MTSGGRTRQLPFEVVVVTCATAVDGVAAVSVLLSATPDDVATVATVASVPTTAVDAVDAGCSAIAMYDVRPTMAATLPIVTPMRER